MAAHKSARLPLRLQLTHARRGADYQRWLRRPRHHADFPHRTVATLASSKVTAGGGRAAAMQGSAAQYKTTFAGVAVAIDKAPASTGKVAATLWHPQVRPWESRRLRLQLPGPGSALLRPWRTHRGRHQKFRASAISQYPGGQESLL